MESFAHLIGIMLCLFIELTPDKRATMYSHKCTLSHERIAFKKYVYYLQMQMYRYIVIEGLYQKLSSGIKCLITHYPCDKAQVCQTHLHHTYDVKTILHKDPIMHLWKYFVVGILINILFFLYKKSPLNKLQYVIYNRTNIKLLKIIKKNKREINS